MENIFSRTKLLIGEKGLNVLANSTVAVFGLGGVGSYTVEALARAGVGNLILVDYDIVVPSNINRQLHALDDTLGALKAELMGERVKKINKSAQVTIHARKYTPENRESFFTIKPDYVVDAIDDIKGKVDLIAYCLNRGIRLVSSMGAGNKLDPTLFKVDDISKTSVCPLARVVRQRLRKIGITHGVKVVYSTEQPRKHLIQDAAGNAPGSISFVPPVAGMILAGIVVNDLLENRHVN